MKEINVKQAESLVIDAYAISEKGGASGKGGAQCARGKRSASGGAESERSASGGGKYLRVGNAEEAFFSPSGELFVTSQEARQLEFAFVEGLPEGFTPRKGSILRRGELRRRAPQTVDYHKESIYEHPCGLRIGARANKRGGVMWYVTLPAELPDAWRGEILEVLIKEVLRRFDLTTPQCLLKTKSAVKERAAKEVQTLETAA